MVHGSSCRDANTRAKREHLPVLNVILILLILLIAVARRRSLLSAPVQLAVVLPIARARLLNQLKILQVSRVDVVGGAARIAWNLFQSYRALGFTSWLAVGQKDSNDSDVLLIPKVKDNWSRVLWSIHARVRSLEKMPGGWRILAAIARVAELRREFDKFWGIEDFRHPSSREILKLPPLRPNIVHCHNLHGDYFDLGALSMLSHEVPVVLTLHGEWWLTGHCSYSFDCERWKIGCGKCPDLNSYPAIRRDATAYNWQRKQAIYAQSKLYVATPSRWLMENVEQSMLMPGVKESRVIPNGVDRSVFHWADRSVVRAQLGLPRDAKILLFTAVNARTNQGKDYGTIRNAVGKVASRDSSQKLIFIALGDEAPPEHVGPAEIRFIQYEKDPESVARYYQAADLYLHAAKADNFPNTVLESLACGTAVVASATGGIPEQIKGLNLVGSDKWNRFGADEATGVLVRTGDAEAMSTVIQTLLNEDTLRQQLGRNAMKDAEQRFDLLKQAGAYLEWYSEVLEEFSGNTHQTNQNLVNKFPQELLELHSS